MKSIKTLLTAQALVVAIGANADTTSFNFTGNTDNLVVSSDTSTFDYYGYLSLINTANGLNYVPSFSVSAGDTLEASITLDKPLTIPASQSYLYINLELGWFLPGPDPLVVSQGVNYGGQSFSLYNNGEAVTQSLDWLNVVASFGAVDIGASLFDAPSLTFDKIVFSVNVTSVEDNGIPISSLTTQGIAPQLTYAYDTPAVPLPATAWLLGSGLIGLTGLARKRQSA